MSSLSRNDPKRRDLSKRWVRFGDSSARVFSFCHRYARFLMDLRGSRLSRVDPQKIMF